MKTCLDCEQPISKAATRCRSCARQYEWNALGRQNHWSSTGRSAIAASNRRRTRPANERFWIKVDQPNANGCREWLASRDRNGYGRFRAEGCMISAHVWAWEDANGPVPDGLYVCHHCDNPPCTEVNHLFLGTAKDNQRDAAAKGRMRNGNEQKTQCPQKHPYSGDNLYTAPNGDRICRSCVRAHHAKYKAQKHQEEPPHD